MRSGGTLLRLTSLRWFAALAVLLCHIGEQPHGPAWFQPAGPLGVSFFFVLSGFVLTWSARSDDSARVFWRRRFARIYPATLASNVAAVFLAVLAVPHCVIRSGWSLLAAVLLLQAWVPGDDVRAAGNSVTWSLACEAFFYALLPILLLMARRHVRAVLSLALGGSAAVFLVTLATRTDYTYYLPLARLPEFILGVVFAVLVQRGWRPTNLPVTGVGLLAFGYLLAAAHLAATQVQVYFTLPGVVLVLLAAVGRDLDNRPGWLTSHRMVYLGEVSFCFYLCHALVLRVVVLDPRTLGGDTSGRALSVLAVVTLAAALIAAIALHHLVELPAQRRILRRAPRKLAVEPVPVPA